MRKVLFVIFSLALVVSATAVLAQQTPPAGPPPGGPGGPGGGGRQGMQMSCPAMAIAPPAASMLDQADALALTGDQKTKLTATLTKADAPQAPLALARQNAAKATRALRDALYAPIFDATKVKQLLLDAQGADAALANAELAVWIEIRANLTPDQVSKLQSQRRGGFGGGGNQPGQGGRRNRNQPTDGGGNPPGQ